MSKKEPVYGKIVKTFHYVEQIEVGVDAFDCIVIEVGCGYCETGGKVVINLDQIDCVQSAIDDCKAELLAQEEQYNRGTDE